MDPFRDELAAAHAKIAKLEGDMRALQEEATQRNKNAPPTASKNFLGLAFFGGIAFCLLVALGFYFGGQSAKTAAAQRDQEISGIATARPPNTSHAIPPIVNPWRVPSASASANWKPPCNCSPGDPLCTCL